MTRTFFLCNSLLSHGLYSPWNSPGQNRVQFSSVAQSCLILCDPMDCSTPGLPVHHQLLEFTQLMCIELVMPSNHLIICYPILLPPRLLFSRGSSQPRDQTQVSCIEGRFFTSWATGKTKNNGVGRLSNFQRIFPTQESNQGLLHCRHILYQLSYQGSPW